MFPVHTVSYSDLKKLCAFKTPNQVVLLVKIPDQTVKDNLFTSGVHLYLDGIQDPGNLGTLIRVADWFGLDSLCCSSDSADFYNPKVVQASMGSIARVHLIRINLEPLLAHTPDEIQVVGCTLDGKNLYTYSLNPPFILVIGNESQGISHKNRSFCTDFISVPKSNESQGPDSLNAAVAGGIICSYLTP